MRLQTEDLALELAARLRVLGKSLSMICPEVKGEKRALEWNAYKEIRHHLDCFLDSVTHTEFTMPEVFNLVRQYLQDTLPLELDHCTGAGLCRIDIVEAVIALLSENVRENEGTERDLVAAFSLGA